MQQDYLRRKPKRHVYAYMDSYTINFIHPRNPWINAWWSAAFPGLGHLMLCKYLVAFSFIFWEVVINYLAGINSAIYYSMIGDIDHAIEAINKKWFLLYIGVYVFAIWDSYTRTIQLNKRYKLIHKKGYDLVVTNISGLELNVLTRRQPIHAIIWSLLVPGFGHLYINRIITSTVFIIWFVILTYFSNVLPAIHYSMALNFQAAKDCIDIQWFLYFPSLYAYVAYDAYINTVEYNKIYDREQANYLQTEYQDKEFDFPI
jgi:hypothetical protein